MLLCGGRIVIGKMNNILQNKTGRRLYTGRHCHREKRCWEVCKIRL